VDSTLRKALQAGYRSARTHLQRGYGIPEYVFYGWINAMRLSHWDYYLEDSGGNAIYWGDNELVYLWEVFDHDDETIFDSDEGGVNEWLLLHTMLNLKGQHHIRVLLKGKGIGKGFGNAQEFIEAIKYGVAHVGNSYGSYVE